MVQESKKACSISNVEVLLYTDKMRLVAKIYCFNIRKACGPIFGAICVDRDKELLGKNCIEAGKEL